MFSKYTLVYSLGLLSIGSLLNADKFVDVQIQEPQLALLPRNQSRAPEQQACPVTVCPCLPEPDLVPAYNHPARIETRSSWHSWVDASFIYWQPIQENMELALEQQYNGANGAELLIGPTNVFNNKLKAFDFDYKPGFKVEGGIKFDYDSWELRAAYTWFHSSQYSSTSVTPLPGQFPTTAYNALIPLWLTPVVVLNNNYSGQPFLTAEGTWRLNMDIAELDLARSYYVGSKLTFRPSMGLRGAWINQKMDAFYTGPFFEYTTIAKSNSWAVGPQFALELFWAVFEKLRIFGSAEADLLYTRYTGLKDKEHFSHNIYGTLVNSYWAQSEGDMGMLRTHIDFELGMGWGTYFNCNKWYLDMSASYGFQVFFDQNMMRRVYDAAYIDPELLEGFPNLFVLSDLSRGSLYIQGLTATVRLDF